MAAQTAALRFPSPIQSKRASGRCDERTTDGARPHTSHSKLLKFLIVAEYVRRRKIVLDETMRPISKYPVREETVYAFVCVCMCAHVSMTAL